MKLGVHKKFILLIVAVWLFAVPLFARAQTANTCGKVQSTFEKYGGGAVLSIFPKYCTPGSLIIKAINIMLGLAGGLSILFIIYGGFQYMSGSSTIIGTGENRKAVENGKKTLTWAIWGLVIVILANAIVQIVTNLFLKGQIF